MAKLKVLVEMLDGEPEPFSAFQDATLTEVEPAIRLLDRIAGLGVEPDGEWLPVPMFSRSDVGSEGAAGALSAFGMAEENAEVPSVSTVLECEVEPDRLADLRSRDGVRVWPNSALTLLDDPVAEEELDGLDMTIDAANSAAGIDCRPFRPGVSIDMIRTLLGVRRIWLDGNRGENIIVGIIDEGVNGDTYPVVGGFARFGAQQPGSAPITSHGSMCAADVLVAAPAAKIFDYPFLGVPRSGGALVMFQAVLDQRRVDGTPHLTNNSYGFAGVPPRETAPGHEIWDLEHPLHRKVREVVASGAAAFFAAGNCGEQCPSGNCHISGIGPGKSIHASNSLAEVITIAAVNSRHERIGYSSQGLGMFEPRKPDLACYSHFFGNFGPGRPGGVGQPFDNGTSAATPVAAGVAALLLSAHPGLSSDRLRRALIDGASSIGGNGWDRDHGFGVISAAASHRLLERGLVP
jgi:subtilisin family serine protease